MSTGILILIAFSVSVGVTLVALMLFKAMTDKYRTEMLRRIDAATGWKASTRSLYLTDRKVEALAEYLAVELKFEEPQRTDAYYKVLVPGTNDEAENPSD